MFEKLIESCDRVGQKLDNLRNDIIALQADMNHSMASDGNAISPLREEIRATKVEMRDRSRKLEQMLIDALKPQ